MTSVDELRDVGKRAESRGMAYSHTDSRVYGGAIFKDSELRYYFEYMDNEVYYDLNNSIYDFGVIYDFGIFQVVGMATDALSLTNAKGLLVYIDGVQSVGVGFKSYPGKPEFMQGTLPNRATDAAFIVETIIDFGRSMKDISVVLSESIMMRHYPRIGNIGFRHKPEVKDFMYGYRDVSSARMTDPDSFQHDKPTEFFSSQVEAGYTLTANVLCVLDAEHKHQAALGDTYKRYFFICMGYKNKKDMYAFVFTDKDKGLVFGLNNFYTAWADRHNLTTFNEYNALDFLAQEHNAKGGLTDSMVISELVELSQLPVLEAQLMATNTDYKKLFFGGVTQIRLRELAQTQTPAWVVKYVNAQTLEPFTNIPAYNPFKGVSMTVCHTKGVYVPFAYGAYLNYGLALPEGDPFLFGNWLAGSKGHEVLAELKQGAETLGLDAAKCFEGEGGLMPYFEPTDGNAGYLLSLLAGWAESEPNGLFVVENRV